MFRNNTYNRKDSKLASVLGILFAVGVFIYFIIGGFSKLFGKSDYMEISIDMAGYGIVVEHSINGLIPTGKDYYYIGLDSESGNIYTIQAGKSWLEDNFNTEDNTSKNGRITLKTKNTRLDYKVSDELSSGVTDPELKNAFNSCYDTLYKSKGVHMLVAALLELLLFLYFLLVIKLMVIDLGKFTGIIGIVLLLATCMVMLTAI
ncbi:MAG: hypothetical protein PUE12_07400 [Oscillospiraceae bacterium]|nr:hypothetical protein [Oscillospiraceae bacterium]